MGTENKYSRRIAFKLKVKDKWNYTYWWNCRVNEIPSTLKEYLNHLTEIFDGDELLIKIERRKNS